MGKYNILVTGANGQLGKCIKETINELSKCTKEINNYFFVSHKELDITNYSDIKTIVTDNNIDVIINCAAYTNVAKAELDGKSLAEDINIFAVENLARVCNENNVFLIHIGTDYIYEGKSNVPTSIGYNLFPINYYGFTKFKGIKSLYEVFKDRQKYIVIVTSWLYSKYENNFVSKIYNKLQDGNREVVNDQTGSPTYAPDLARFIVKICEDDCFERLNEVTNGYRLLHFANEGTATWYDLAKGIEEYGNTKGKVIPVWSGCFDDVVRRPNYTVLDLSLTKQIFPEFNFRYWREALKECINEIEKEKVKN